MSYAVRVESNKFAFATVARSGPAPINVVQGEAAALPLPSANVGHGRRVHGVPRRRRPDGAAAKWDGCYGRAGIFAVRPFSSAQGPSPCTSAGQRRSLRCTWWSDVTERRDTRTVDGDRYEWPGEFRDDELGALHVEAFGYSRTDDDWTERLHGHRLGWVYARRGGGLIGFVDVAWDGAAHAFFLIDTVVTATDRHRVVGTTLVFMACAQAAAAGSEWLHVDSRTTGVASTSTRATFGRLTPGSFGCGRPETWRRRTRRHRTAAHRPARRPTARR